MVGTSPSMMDHLPPFSKRQIFQWSEEVPCPGRTHNFIKDFPSWTAWKHTTTKEKVSKVSTCNNIFQSKALSRCYGKLLTRLNCLCCHTACTMLEGRVASFFSLSLHDDLSSCSWVYPKCRGSHGLVHPWLRFPSRWSLASCLQKPITPISTNLFGRSIQTMTQIPKCHESWEAKNQSCSWKGTNPRECRGWQTLQIVFINTQLGWPFKLC
jgi:hypothetical protein